MLTTLQIKCVLIMNHLDVYILFVPVIIKLHLLSKSSLGPSSCDTS